MMKTDNKRRTMKKVYIAPAVEVVELETLSMLAQSGLDNNIGIGNGGSSTGGEGIEPQTNRYRGEWGNLWK